MLVSRLTGHLLCAVLLAGLLLAFSDGEVGGDSAPETDRKQKLYSSQKYIIERERRVSNVPTLCIECTCMRKVTCLECYWLENVCIILYYNVLVNGREGISVSSR